MSSLLFFRVTECELTSISWREPAVICRGTLDCGGAGRRPEGYRGAEGEVASPAGFFARASAIEAASVVAFTRLAEELELHGARGLSHAARAAAEDETRHAPGSRVRPR